jgi:importin subunit beta-1
MQAIEFWSTLGDREYALNEEGSGANMRYVVGAARELLPILCQCLTKQSEDDDDDNYGKPQAAGACIGVIAETVGPDALDHVLPCVVAWMGSADWHFVEAAALAFGYSVGSCINEGANEKAIRASQQVLPILFDLLRHKIPLVRDTVAWTIGRICEFCFDAFSGMQRAAIIDALASLLHPSAGNEGKILKHACWVTPPPPALLQLAKPPRASTTSRRT